MFRWVYCNLGHILRLKGDIGAARRSIEKSMDYFSSLDDKYYSAGKAESYFRLSSVLLAENSIIDSEKNLQKSQEYVIKSGIRWVKGIYNKIKFDMLTKNGRFDEAQDALQEAWDANAGSYGYQQKSLLRRVATTPKCCPDKLYLYLRDNHSNCPNCDGQTVEQMAKCTLASSKYTIFSD
jgi:tetratricopeptide (TPR) repeat protein